MKIKLGEICIIDWGNTSLTKKSYVKNGKFLAVSAKGCDGRINHYEHDEDVCVLSAIGARCGRMFFPQEKFTAIKNTITLKPKKELVDSKFLYYLFTSVKLPQRGAAQPFMSKGDIEKFEINSLPNIEEQQNIVAKLDMAFNKIDKTINLIEQKNKNISYLLDVLIKNKFLLDNQKNQPLKNVSNIINGYAFKSQDFSNDNTGIKSIKITNVGLNKFEENNKDFLPKKFNEKYPMFKAEYNDLVFALTRSIIKGGLKLAKIPKSYHGALLNQRVALIKPKKDKILLDYLFFYLHSDIVKKYVINNVNTLMQPNLSISDLKLLPIPMESLEKQKLIIDNLNTANNLTLKVKKNLIKKKSNFLQLKYSLLKTHIKNKVA